MPQPNLTSFVGELERFQANSCETGIIGNDRSGFPRGMIRPGTMQGTLVLAILTIKGSYSRAIDFPLDGGKDVPDTVQWWFGEGGCWRIRTFALDHDIHVYRIGDSPRTTLNLATENNEKHFGDQIKVQHVIPFLDCAEQAELQAKFQQIGLTPRLEINPGQFAFWKPDAAKYWTQSTPK